jgi:hypothetical protein
MRIPPFRYRSVTYRYASAIVRNIALLYEGRSGISSNNPLSRLHVSIWALMMEAWLTVAAGLMTVAQTLRKGNKTDYPKPGLNHES